MREHWHANRPLCVHAPASRLEPLLAAHSELRHTATVVDGATQCVVFLNSVDGRAQHFPADRATAKRCLLSGASVYISPADALEETWIAPLAREINGGPFAARLDELAGNGGEVEVFACACRHTTSWHADRQSNFTLQLSGTKIWQLRSGIEAPSANMPAHIEDKEHRDLMRAVHAQYANFDLPQFDSSEGVTTVTLRPGSMLFVPAGVFHRVVCDDNEGSISIGFSVMISSHLDLILPALQALLQTDPRWRARVYDADVHEQLADLLRDLPSLVSQLSVDCVLPPIVRAPDADSQNGEMHVSAFEPAEREAAARWSFSPIAAFLPPEEDRISVLEREAAVRIGAELPLRRLCDECSQDAGSIGMFCRWCGCRLAERPALASFEPQKAEDERIAVSDLRFRAFVAPHPTRRPLVAVDVVVPPAAAAFASHIARRKQVPADAQNDDERRLLSALHFVGVLVGE